MPRCKNITVRLCQFSDNSTIYFAVTVAALGRFWLETFLPQHTLIPPACVHLN